MSSLPARKAPAINYGSVDVSGTPRLTRLDNQNSLYQGSLLDVGALPPGSLTSMSAEPVMTWLEFFMVRAGLPTSHAEQYAEIFSKEEIPALNSSTCTWMTNEFLTTLGIALAGHRAQILEALARKVSFAQAHAMPRKPPNWNDHNSASTIRYRSESYAPNRDASPVSASTAPASEAENKGQPRPHLDRIRLQNPLEGDDVCLQSCFTLTVNTFKSNPFGSVRNEDGSSATTAEPQYTWVDVCGKDRYPYSQYKHCISDLTDAYGIHPALLRDADFSLPMPQVVVSPIKPTQFLVIVRVANLVNDPTDDALGELTNRWMVVVDMESRYIVTVHRLDTTPLAQIRKKWDQQFSHLPFRQVVLRILDRSLVSFFAALQRSEDLLDLYESKMLTYSVMTMSQQHPHPTHKHQTKESHTHPRITTKASLACLLYHLNRRASVYGRMLFLSVPVLETVCSLLSLPADNEHVSRLMGLCEDLSTRTSQMRENSQSLLNLHLSLASHRTNELMGLLTIFSAFFIPLTFIAGFYGMNFKGMPELDWRYGYQYCLSLMVVSACIVVALFRYKGLL